MNSAVRDNLLWLGGTTGVITQSAFAGGSSSGPTTVSASYVDLTDMTVTLTTGGGDVLVFLVVNLSNTNVGALTIVAISQDAAAEVGAMNSNQAVANYSSVVVSMQKFTAPSAASHTYKGRWQTNAGTSTANGVGRFLLAVELRR